ncbi:DUF808 family protein, partial [Vibrio harveyi]|uniref:DUF808 family protein n=1 Tax=Vibrio harveyi TaxID=669 RepID=UPI0018F16105
ATTDIYTSRRSSAASDVYKRQQQVSGVRAEREIPVVLAVAKGSLWNKCILVPAALLISAVAPWLITPMLLVGGLFLCFEAVSYTHLRAHETLP